MMSSSANMMGLRKSSINPIRSRTPRPEVARAMLRSGRQGVQSVAEALESGQSGVRAAMARWASEEEEEARRQARLRRRQQIVSCCKSFIAFLFSHVGLAAMVVAYSIMGGFLFQAIEAPHEINEKLEMQKFKEALISDIRQVLETRDVSILRRRHDVTNYTNITDHIRLVFIQLQERVTLAVKNNGWDGKDTLDDASQQWSFAGALLYAVTVITTIGYGHIAPKTTLGRMVTIIYALIGIPLTFLYLSNIGNFLANCFRLFYRKICCDVCCCMKCDRKRKLKQHTMRKRALIRAASRYGDRPPGLLSSAVTDTADEDSASYVERDAPTCDTSEQLMFRCSPTDMNEKYANDFIMQPLYAENQLEDAPEIKEGLNCEKSIRFPIAIWVTGCSSEALNVDGTSDVYSESMCNSGFVTVSQRSSEALTASKSSRTPPASIEAANSVSSCSRDSGCILTLSEGISRSFPAPLLGNNALGCVSGVCSSIAVCNQTTNRSSNDNCVPTTLTEISCTSTATTFICVKKTRGCELIYNLPGNIVTHDDGDAFGRLNDDNLQETDITDDCDDASCLLTYDTLEETELTDNDDGDLVRYLGNEGQLQETMIVDEDDDVIRCGNDENLKETEIKDDDDDAICQKTEENLENLQLNSKTFLKETDILNDSSDAENNPRTSPAGGDQSTEGLVTVYERELTSRPTVCIESALESETLTDQPAALDGIVKPSRENISKEMTSCEIVHNSVHQNLACDHGMRDDPVTSKSGKLRYRDDNKPTAAAAVKTKVTRSRSSDSATFSPNNRCTERLSRCAEALPVDSLAPEKQFRSGNLLPDSTLSANTQSSDQRVPVENCTLDDRQHPVNSLRRQKSVLKRLTDALLLAPASSSSTSPSRHGAKVSAGINGNIRSRNNLVEDKRLAFTESSSCTQHADRDRLKRVKTLPSGRKKGRANGGGEKGCWFKDGTAAGKRVGRSETVKKPARRSSGSLSPSRDDIEKYINRYRRDKQVLGLKDADKHICSCRVEKDDEPRRRVLTLECNDKTLFDVDTIEEQDSRLRTVSKDGVTRVDHSTAICEARSDDMHLTVNRHGMERWSSAVDNFRSKGRGISTTAGCESEDLRETERIPRPAASYLSLNVPSDVGSNHVGRTSSPFGFNYENGCNTNSCHPSFLSVRSELFPKNISEEMNSNGDVKGYGGTIDFNIKQLIEDDHQFCCYDDEQRVTIDDEDDNGMLLFDDDPFAEHDDDEDLANVTVPISVCLIIIAAYILGGSVLFTLWENWDLFTGSYFCFITLSTIGFGDIVPGTDMTEWASHEKLVLCALWLAFGLSLLAMCFNLMQEEVREKCRRLGRKLGLLNDGGPM